jgi:hypothetical protein
MKIGIDVVDHTAGNAALQQRRAPATPRRGRVRALFGARKIAAGNAARETERRMVEALRGTAAGETQQPPMTAEEFEVAPDFARFKVVMKRLLAVPKLELDRKVRVAKKKSPRAGNPDAPGRKREVTHLEE